jgi:hypothetical protein
MKQYIYEEFALPQFNMTNVVKKISTGKPTKIWGFIPGPVEALDLFTPDGEGRNIFHYLAIKGKLGSLLHHFFGTDVSTDMLQREGVLAAESLIEIVKTPDIYGYSVLRIMAQFEPASVPKLQQYGIKFTDDDIKFTTDFCIKFFKNFKDEMVKTQCKDAAEIFFLCESMLKGDKKIFEEYTWQLYPYLPFIVQTVRDLYLNNYPKSSQALEIFISIFQQSWPEVLSHTENMQLNMQKILHLSKAVDNKRKESITLDQWAKLLGQPNFKDIKQVQDYILGESAKRFLDGTLHTMKFEDLIVNKDAVKSAQLTELTKEIKTISETSVASDDTKVKTVAAEPIGETAIPNTVGEKSKNTRPDLNPSSASSKQFGEALSVKQLADEIQYIIDKNPSYTAYLNEELGSPYNQLHSFISLLGNRADFFDKQLKKIAKETETIAISGNDFLTQYVQTIKQEDLVAITNTKKPSITYDLVCLIKNAHLAKLLLDKGLELKIYSADDLSTHFQAIIKYNAPKIMSGLLQRSGITIDWYYLLSQAVKYCNNASKYTINYYVAHEELHIVKDVRSREGKIEKDPKYTLLNKALFNLCILASHSYKEGIEEKIHTASVEKLLILSELVEKLLSSKKIDYAENNLTVCTKTLSLLKHFARCVNKISENDKTKSSIAAANTIMHKMLEQYESLTLPEEGLTALTKLKAWIDNLDDNQSQRSSMSAASDITHLSVLSGIDDLDLDSYDLEYMNTSGTEIMALGESNQ